MSTQEKGCKSCQTEAQETSTICPDCGISYEEKKTCGHCGHSAFGTFMNDTCPGCGKAYWKCGNCQRIVSADVPPEICPACNEKCDFKNVTCYTPECGGPGNIDHRL